MHTYALFTADRLPKKPYCSDDKTASRIRSLTHALKYAYIQPNPPGLLYWLVFDIDREDASWRYEDVIAPSPNLIVVNPQNGHAHYYYALKAPVNTGERGRLKPKQYAESVYRGLGAILGADAHYARLMAKNPLHPSHITLCPRSEPYELADLDEYIVRRGEGKVWQAAARAKGEVVNLEGRNCTTFDRLRAWAYSWIGTYRTSGASFDDWHMACRRQAEAFAEFPGHSKGDLPQSEVKATAKSVATWTWRHYDGRRGSNEDFPQVQAARGRMKGRRKREEFLSTAKALKAEGKSNKAIAAALAVSAPTIANWLKR